MSRIACWLGLAAALVVLPTDARVVAAQSSAEKTPLAIYDEVLETQVRDGYVYYRALKAQRGGLDRYIASLAGADVPGGRDAEAAFWLNAYNAIVLQTVINHYPLQSLRTVAGAFDAPHRIGGRSMSLNQIELRLAEFKDPRMFLALGRGAADSGRLRSEIYTAEQLDRQLQQQAEECASRDRCIRVDGPGNRVLASEIFQWRKKEFADAYAAAAGRRQPLERAVVAIASLHRLDAEREVLATDRFRIDYLPFDWSLNDLARR